MNKQLAAVTAKELNQAQQGVLQHVNNRLVSLRLDADIAQSNIDRALKSKFAVRPFRDQLRKTERKIAYYEKIKAAVAKGYLIIPDVWNSDCFAMRVKDGKKVRWDRWGDIRLQKLPLGEGDYIDAKPILEHRYVEIDGKIHKEVVSRSADNEIEFPVKVVNPMVLDATQVAMEDKIFDRFRLARQGGDPFVLGEICNPLDNYQSITFFIAWFLDVDSL